jgi:hypothetical protein
VIEVDALADESIPIEKEEESRGDLHLAACGRNAGPDAARGSAKHAFDDHSVVRVIVGAFTEPEIRMLPTGLSRRTDFHLLVSAPCREDLPR